MISRYTLVLLCAAVTSMPLGAEGSQKEPAGPVEDLIKRKVLWAVPVTRSGAAGWLLSEVASGPPDPRSAAHGITMGLKCSRRLDPNTPDDLCTNEGEWFLVPFTLDNYAERWYFLDTLPDSDAAATSAAASGAGSRKRRAEARR